MSSMFKGIKSGVFWRYMNNADARISRVATIAGSWVHALQQARQKMWGSGSTFTPLSSYASSESHHHLQNKKKYTNNWFYYFLDLSLWFCVFLIFPPFYGYFKQKQWGRGVVEVVIGKLMYYHYGQNWSWGYHGWRWHWFGSRWWLLVVVREIKKFVVFWLKGCWEALWLADKDTLQNAPLLGREKQRRRKSEALLDGLSWRERSRQWWRSCLATKVKRSLKAVEGGLVALVFSLKKMEGCERREGLTMVFLKERWGNMFISGDKRLVWLSC